MGELVETVRKWDGRVGEGERKGFGRRGLNKLNIERYLGGGEKDDETTIRRQRVVRLLAK